MIHYISLQLQFHSVVKRSADCQCTCQYKWLTNDTNHASLGEWHSRPSSSMYECLLFKMLNIFNSNACQRLFTVNLNSECDVLRLGEDYSLCNNVLNLTVLNLHFTIRCTQQFTFVRSIEHDSKGNVGRPLEQLIPAQALFLDFSRRPM